MNCHQSLPEGPQPPKAIAEIKQMMLERKCRHGSACTARSPLAHACSLPRLRGGLGGGATCSVLAASPSLFLPASGGEAARAERHASGLKLQLLFRWPSVRQPQRVERMKPAASRCRRRPRFLEGDEVLVVERILALAPDHADAALVELELDAAA